jgi:hypothetical protein
MVTREGDAMPNYTKPDGTYDWIEAYKQQGTITETEDGQFLYHGRTDMEVIADAEHRIALDDREIMEKVADSFEVYVAQLADTLKKKTDDAIAKAMNPFWFLNAINGWSIEPTVASVPTPPAPQPKREFNVIEMKSARKKRGRPKTPSDQATRERLLVYFFTKKWILAYLEDSIDVQMPWEFVAALMNEGIDQNHRLHRTPKRYSQIFEKAKKEAEQEPFLYEHAFHQVFLDEGFSLEDYDKWLKDGCPSSEKLLDWVYRKNEAIKPVALKYQKTGKLIQ